MAEIHRLGRPVEVDPAEAMLAMVHEAAGNVAVYRWLVQSLAAEVDRHPGVLAAEVDEDEVDLEAVAALGQGIAGRVDPENWRAAPHVWVTLYNEERERLVRWSKACRDAGVEERRIQLTEQRGALLVGAVRGILTEVAEVLGVDIMALPQLGAIVRRHAMKANVLEAGGAEVASA